MLGGVPDGRGLRWGTEAESGGRKPGEKQVEGWGCSRGRVPGPSAGVAGGGRGGKRKRNPHPHRLLGRASRPARPPARGEEHLGAGARAQCRRVRPRPSPTTPLPGPAPGPAPRRAPLPHTSPRPSGFAQGVGPGPPLPPRPPPPGFPAPAMAEDPSAAASYTEDDFYCPVCQEVLKTPVRTAACQHV